MSNVLTTAPVRPFQRVLESLATRMGWDPARIQQNQSAALTAYLNTAMQTVWNFYEWPEIMQSELLPAPGGVIPWQATPVETRVAMNLLGTNGYFTLDLSGWTQFSGALWTWSPANDGSAAFSCLPADTVEGAAGLAQTITGLTIGQTYRLTVEVALPTTGFSAGLLVRLANGSTVLHMSNYLTNSQVYTVDVVAPATSATLTLKLYPGLVTTNPSEPRTGQVTRCTLESTALVRSAPRNPIDMVAGVFTTDPLETDEPVPMPFHLGPGCLYLTGTARDATEAWVYYRPQCPQFTATGYTATTSYQSGGLNELAFDSATGHVYRAQHTRAFTAIPVTNTGYWQVQGVPERFAEALVQLARAEALEEQDQFAKALRARTAGLEFLENAMLTHYRQSGQTRTYRSAA